VLNSKKLQSINMIHRQQIKQQQAQQPRPSGMVIKTKKYELDKQLYIRLAMEQVMKEFWYAWFVPILILLIPIFVSGAIWWCVGIAFVVSLLYVLFWAAQFTAVTQMEQGKLLFEKLFYEIDGKNIIIKRNEKEGMVMTWEQIKSVTKNKTAFLFWLSRGQFIYFPFEAFKEHELKMLEGLLKRKNILNEKTSLKDIILATFNKKAKPTSQA
jgi:hypothetical protein